LLKESQALSACWKSVPFGVDVICGSSSRQKVAPSPVIVNYIHPTVQKKGGHVDALIQSKKKYVRPTSMQQAKSKKKKAGDFSECSVLVK
jgi:hypothetical protein